MLNYKSRVAYLRKPQDERLIDIKETINKEYGISVPIAEIVRDSVDLFIEKHGNNLEDYIKSKGF